MSSNKRNKADESTETGKPIEIPLGQSLICWVSPEDGDLARLGWSPKAAGKPPNVHYYARHKWTAGGIRGEYYLHTMVWEKVHDTVLPKGFLVDHINGDKLDNRRCNLRLATRTDNEANKKKRRTQSGGAPSSKYKGVSKAVDKPRTKPWRVTITVDKKQYALGMYASEKEAGLAYNKAAIEKFGEFAYINEIEENDE
jgi:hypothetical protein